MFTSNFFQVKSQVIVFESKSSQVKSSQIYLYSTFHVQNNTKCFTEIKALQQGAEKALKICKIIERNNLNELKLIKTSNSLDK